MNTQPIVDRIYEALLDGNRTLAAAGVPSNAKWTEENARKLAVAIVKEGRRQGVSNSVAITNTKAFVTKTVNTQIARMKR